MAKRVAGKQLTDLNWEEEDPPEEIGEFVPASEDILKTRQIKKAKRRGPGGTSEISSSSEAFKGFAGFGGAPKSLSSFSFGSNNTIKSSDEKENLNTANLESKTILSSFKVNDNSNEKKSIASDEKEKLKNDYLSQLRSLNEGVSKWIKQHVDANPYCMLTPIFKDYEDHLATIKKSNPDKQNEVQGDKKTESVGKKDDSSNSADATEQVSNPSDKQSSLVTTSNSQANPNEENSSKSSGSFGGFSFSNSTSNAGGFSFKTLSDSDSGSKFSFKPLEKVNSESSTPAGGFSFGSLVAAKINSDQPTSSGNNDEEYVPPKNETTEVVEDDALYTKRCKLFYQNKGAWVERGVGNIHLKPCNDKTQLLIRADTNLGNILLNIMLSSSIPFKRQGKNNVSMVCIPNPPIDPKSSESKPVSMLLRVKTAEDADELLTNIEKYKKD